jgi:hypothetical protein
MVSSEAFIATLEKRRISEQTNVRHNGLHCHRTLGCMDLRVDGRSPVVTNVKTIDVEVVGELLARREGADINVFQEMTF